MNKPTLKELNEASLCGKHPQQAKDFKDKYGRPYWEVTDLATKFTRNLLQAISHANKDENDGTWGKARRIYRAAIKAAHNVVDELWGDA